ncbi:hypothetical protein [Terrisporobacter sp.]|uniref:hypothetical protein n=1 Tax=Terrisporobacter sp. TaxID=1965305 RepID=UPI00399622AA
MKKNGMRLSDMLIEAVELVEREFPAMEWEELSEKVYTLIEKVYDVFFEWPDVDKFDYLVDNIIAGM